jgi:hypothetical protein
MFDETSDESLLIRSWTHSYEEDHDGVLVFRPSEREFPPARGRDSFDLAPGGVLLRTGPGPDDRTQRTSGRWSRQGDRLDLYPTDSSQYRYRVVGVGPDLLEVRPIDEEVPGDGGTDANA